MPEANADSPYILDLPAHFPEPEIPEDNALTQKRVELGKALFYDKRLSRDNSLSCGSCHFQEFAFTDQLPKSIGINGRTGIRNAPTLANVAYRNRLMMDGGVPTLELQIMAPLHDPNEFDFNILEAGQRLNQDDRLRQLSLDAYNREIDPYVIIRAIASFERTIISGNAAWDRYLNGDVSALSEQAKRGEALFFSERTSCGSCHAGVNLSDERYHNVGLYTLYSDEGRARITMSDSDQGKFKTPSLRNIALTAPYMHDGSLETLRDVLLFFNSGGDHHPGKDKRIRQLNLNEEEIEDLVAFLEALTDNEFIFNPEYQP
jgi:cytochrome c peroxidase